MGPIGWPFAVALAVLAYSVSRLVKGSGPLDREQGRRKARQRIRKSASFYEALGVASSEDYFINSRGVELFTKQWLPRDGVIRGVIFYCHGYGDTCTYLWEDVAVRLAQAQYLVVGLDYEGFGLSAGLHGYIPKFDTLVDDVVEFTDSLQGRHELSALPFFLFGESMGGAVAIKVHWKRPLSWRGAVLLAPMCKIGQEMMPPPFVVALLLLLSRVFPTWKMVPQSDIPELGWRQPEKRIKASTNPLAYEGRPRLKTAAQLLLTTQEIARNMDQVSLPFLLLHGAADMVTNPAMSQALYESASSRDKTFQLVEDAWHALLTGEPDDVAKSVLNDIVAWLDARSSATVRRLSGPLSPSSGNGLGDGSGAPSLRAEEEDAESAVTCK